MDQYNRSQIAWPLIIVLLLIEPILIGIFAMNPSSQAALALLVLGESFFMLLLALFFKLTVRVFEDKIYLSFGIGLVKKNFSLDEIHEVKEVRNSVIMGWGIRYYGAGWMWNVNGLDAIELHFKDNSQFRIGTDEPTRLREIIQAKIS